MDDVKVFFFSFSFFFQAEDGIRDYDVTGVQTCALPIFKIMDSSVICDYRMVEFMKSVATGKKIKWQPEILRAGGTDTAGLQRMTPGGSIAGAVSLPTRHIHQVIEMCHKKDIADAIKLLAACVCELDKHDWSF